MASVAFSGLRYDREGNALDHKLVEAGEGEDILIATFDLGRSPDTVT